MSREIRSRLLTLLTLVVVAGALFVYARREDLLHAPRPVTGLLYPGLQTEAITLLTLHLVHGQELELRREPGGPWRITQPTQEQARQDYVAKLLDDLARAQVQPLEERLGPLAADGVGLEPPRFMIAFGTDSERETLFLGEPEPLGAMVYARRAGDDRVVLVTNNLITLLQFNGSDFTDPAVLRGLRGPVTHVRIEVDGGVLLDAVRSGEHWSLREPAAVQADDARITQLVRSLQFLQQARVAVIDPRPEKLHEMGLPDLADRAASDWRGATLIELGSEGEPPVRAWIGAGWQRGGDEALALRDQGTKVLGVPRAALALLTNTPEYFRERHLLPPLRERVQSLRVEREGDPLLDIRRGDDGAWTFREPTRLAGEPVENERIEAHSALSDFLERIDGLQATAFCEPPDGAPLGRLVIGWTRAGESLLDSVELFAQRDGLVPARTSERPGEGLLLPAEVLSLLAPEVPDLLRGLSPLDIDAERWHGFRVVFAAGQPALGIARDAAGGWTGDDAWGRRFGLARDLLRGFRGFRWQAARPAAEYPWSVEYLDAEGGTLALIRLRLPGPGEDKEANGYPCALAALETHAGVELVIGRQWVDEAAALPGDLERKP